MRLSTSCHSATSCAPKKLVANTPVMNTTTRVSTAPRPGMCTPSQLSVWNDAGSRSSDWSSASKMILGTQIVMTSGIQMSRPVMKCFRTVPERKDFLTRPSGRGFRFGFAVGLAVGLAMGLGVRLAVGLRLGGLLGLFGFVGLLLRSALEVGGVPARALELEAGGAQLLAVARLAAGGAHGKRRLGHLLQVLVLVAAGLATVLVDR